MASINCCWRPVSGAACSPAPAAGALCWFRYGYSASRRYSNPDNFPYIRIRALGWFNAIFCAHAVAEARLELFREFMRGQYCVGLALDDHCAIEIIDGQLAHPEESRSRARRAHLAAAAVSCSARLLEARKESASAGGVIAALVRPRRRVLSRLRREPLLKYGPVGRRGRCRRC